MAIEFFAKVTPTKIKLIPTLGYTLVSKEDSAKMSESELELFEKLSDGSNLQVTSDLSIKPIVVDLKERKIGMQNNSLFCTSEQFRAMKSTFSMVERLERKIAEKLFLEGQTLESEGVDKKQILNLVLANFPVIGGCIMTSNSSIVFDSKGKRNRNTARTMIDSLSWSSVIKVSSRTSKAA